MRALLSCSSYLTSLKLRVCNVLSEINDDDNKNVNVNNNQNHHLDLLEYDYNYLQN